MSLFRRRDLLEAGLRAGALSALGAPFLALSRAEAFTTESCETRAPTGRLRGLRRDGADSYLGIPYGTGVSGARRFRAASPVADWPGVYDATRLRYSALQPGQSWAPGEAGRAEECLYLNVWTPSHMRPGTPVMVYNHGGGVTMGSSGTFYTNGANLARHHDVVVVSTNHRLGLLGFLYLDELGGEEYRGSGNNGLSDIALALRWVRRNIAAFGGDPDNVTIFGESGGGLKTSCLYAMTAAKDLFHKASIESGPGIRLMEKDRAAENSERVLHHLGLNRSNWRDLVHLPADRILAAQAALGQDVASIPAFRGRDGIGAVGLEGIGPVMDGQVFTAHPFDPVAPAISRDKPLMTGGNADEETYFAFLAGDMAAFSLDEAGLLARARQSVGEAAPALVAAYRQEQPSASPSQVFIAMQSDLFSGIGARAIAERKVAQGGAPVYLYDFAYARGDMVPGTDYPFGTPHGLDMAVKFDNPVAPPPETGLPALTGPRPERFAMCHRMAELWTNFARNGRPSAAGQPEWPAYDRTTRPVMRIDLACRVERDPRPAVRRFWEQHALLPV